MILESLVKPLREEDIVVETQFYSPIGAKAVRLIPTTRQPWEEATRLRARTGLKTPDALHAAAALHAECTLFIANDNDFRRIGSLDVVVLDGLL